MKKIIFRKPFISKEDKGLGSLHFDKAQFWLNTSTFTDEEDIKRTCLQMADMYYDKACRKLGFLCIEDMVEYYKRYRHF